jgi:hypothetical protein
MCAVNCRRQDNRGVAGVEGGSDNHIRLKLFGLPNGLQRIPRFDGLELRPSAKLSANSMAEGLVVLDDQNPQRHSG